MDINKLYSYRRETALLGALVLAKGARLQVEDNILKGCPLWAF